MDNRTAKRTAAVRRAMKRLQLGPEAILSLMELWDDGCLYGGLNSDKLPNNLWGNPTDDPLVKEIPE